MRLILEPNTSDPDAVYEMLLDMNRDLDEVQSARTNARLILLLANHIGDKEVIAEAARFAKKSTTPRQDSEIFYDDQGVDDR